jgi:predicted transcriptional regulator
MSILDYLKFKKINKKQFAQLVGITPTSLCNYFSGKRRPTSRIAAKMMEVSNGKITMKDILEMGENK